MRNRRDPDDVLLTLQQAAARLRIPPHQVRELIDSGYLQPAIARPLRLRIRDVDAVRQREREPSVPTVSHSRSTRPAVREVRCLACSRTLAYAAIAAGRLRLSPPRGARAVLIKQTDAGLRCTRCGGRPYLDTCDPASRAS